MSIGNGKRLCAHAISIEDARSGAMAEQQAYHICVSIGGSKV